MGTITIKFVGTANVNEQVVRANMQLHEGADLDDTVLDRDIRNLYKTGLFEFVADEVGAGERPDLRSGHRGDPEVPGAGGPLQRQQEGEDRASGEGSEDQLNTALDERQVKEDSEKIREYYQKEGFNQVSVTYKIERDRATGFGSIASKSSRATR